MIAITRPAANILPANIWCVVSLCLCIYYNPRLVWYIITLLLMLLHYPKSRSPTRTTLNILHPDYFTAGQRNQILLHYNNNNGNMKGENHINIKHCRLKGLHFIVFWMLMFWQVFFGPFSRSCSCSPNWCLHTYTIYIFKTRNVSFYEELRMKLI